MADELKVGDPVLFFGKTLAVSAIEDGVAVVVDPVAVKQRDDNRAKIMALREQQADLKGDAHDAIANQIAELDTAYALFTLKLRKELLTYWDERKVWVSEGRILSDDQMDVFRKIMGHKPAPDSHRDALAFIGSMSSERYNEVLDKVKAERKLQASVDKLLEGDK